MVFFTNRKIIREKNKIVNTHNVLSDVPKFSRDQESSRLQIKLLYTIDFDVSYICTKNTEL